MVDSPIDFTDTGQINIGSSLANITSDINQYVVAPLAAFGIGGYIFNAVGESTANLSAEITDHYVEDNSAVQDQIAIRPKRITLKGYVGELIYNSPGNAPTTFNTLAQKLTSLTSFLPAITSAATQAQQDIENPTGISFPGILGTASNIYGLVQNSLNSFGLTKNQQNAYNYFRALMQSKTLMGIQTPWEFMTNMAIESIVAIQPEISMWITDFSISLKEIRIAQTTSVPQSNLSAQSAGTPGVAGAQSTPATLSPIASIQQAPTTNLGNLNGAISSITSFTSGNF